MKKVLVLSGSPRKNGNSDLLALTFAKGVVDGGNETAIFEAGRENISGCMACETCWSKGRACSLDDGFTRLAPYLESCDVIAFVAPVYWFGMPAQLKAAIDRFYAYVVPFRKKEMRIKASCLLMCAGDPDLKVFDGSVTTYKAIAEYMQWEDLGALRIPGVFETGAIEHSGLLDQAYAMGKSIK